MAKVSIIVPVYNAEKYIRRCIESILVQTFTDFELLLINDGSEDKSGQICEEYASRDTRVRVFHKDNGGVSSARNLGLDNALGEWIIFVDSDDWIEKDCVDSCIVLIQKIPNVDIIRYGYHKEAKLNNITNTCNRDYIVSTPHEMIKLCRKFSFWGFIWNTVYKRSILGELRFDNNLCWLEDHIFTYRYIGQCQLMYLLNKPLYHYSIFNSGLSCVKDAYTVKRAGEEEFLAISAIIGVEDAINGYYCKLKEAINVLYKYENEYYKRKIFYEKFTILPQITVHKDWIINLYNNRNIPFFMKDWVLKVRIKFKHTMTK